MTVAGAAYGIFGDAELWGIAAQNVVCILALCRCMQDETGQMECLFSVGNEGAHIVFRREQAEQITPHPCLQGTDAERFLHFVRHRNLMQVVCGKIHFIQIAVPLHRQIAAQGIEYNLRHMLLIVIQ